MKLWILTEEYNSYDQYGEYFLAVWVSKPTKEQLKALIPEQGLDHVLNGGGRQGVEDQWYLLEQVEEGL